MTKEGFKLLHTSQGTITDTGTTYQVERWRRPDGVIVNAPTQIDPNGEKMYLQSPDKIRPGSPIDVYGYYHP